MHFNDLNIISPILKNIEKEGYDKPSPIQERAIPILLEGKDLLASAQTGTGKTAAFAIPIIQRLHASGIERGYNKHIRALILVPTRELAEQIKESFQTYSFGLGLSIGAIYGGVSQRSQETMLNRGVDVLIATPGRLIDLLNQGIIHLDRVQMFVLDEADRMLDMGFIRDVNKITQHIPKQRQSMLFSATLPKAIVNLSLNLLHQPVQLEVTPPDVMLDQISQHLFYVSKKDKLFLLLDILKDPKMKSVLIFTRTKHGANKVLKELLTYGVKADAIHGNKSQNKRQGALKSFKMGAIRVLVATDIAARGIDIDELSLVINYDLPETPETYIHRMGRTGRAGLYGDSYAFCMPEEKNLLLQIEKHIKMKLPVNDTHAHHIRNMPDMSLIQNQNNGKKTQGISMKKDKSKFKKSYHELVEEQETEKSGFKRSDLPRKAPVFTAEPDEKAKPVQKRKDYLPKDPDRNEKEFRPRTNNDFKKPFSPKKDAQTGYKGNARPKFQNQIRKPNKV